MSDVCLGIQTFIAVGALDKVTNVPAASYRTAGLDELSRLYMHRINLARSDGLAWHTCIKSLAINSSLEYVEHFFY